MIKNEFIESAKKIAETLTINEIRFDGAIFTGFLNRDINKNFIVFYQKAYSQDELDYSVSDGFLMFIMFLIDKYNNKKFSMAVFLKILETANLNVSDRHKLNVEISADVFYSCYDRILITNEINLN